MATRRRKPKKRYNVSPFNVLHDRIANSVKTINKVMGGGRSKLSPYFPGFQYPSGKNRNGHPNHKYNQNDNINGKKGYHWKNGQQFNDHYVTDYENTDAFSHFDGNFFLEKIGKNFHCWINLVNVAPINRNGTAGKEITNLGDKKYCESWYKPDDDSKSFTLSSIGAWFAKRNNFEDLTEYPHTYNDINVGCGAVKYWNIIDGGNDNPNKPKIIAHAGETIIIDTGRMKVYNLDGTNLTKYTSFSSTFPPLNGGQPNYINFYPTVGADCNVDVTYIPRIK